MIEGHAQQIVSRCHGKRDRDCQDILLPLSDSLIIVKCELFALEPQRSEISRRLVAADRKTGVDKKKRRA
jgi:hypothetical protein